MTILTRPWGRLTLAGKILIPLLIAFVGVQVALIALWMSGLLPWLTQVVLDVLRNGQIIQVVLDMSKTKGEEKTKAQPTSI